MKVEIKMDATEIMLTSYGTAESENGCRNGCRIYCTLVPYSGLTQGSTQRKVFNNPTRTFCLF